MPYEECKVYSDGSHYIAIPYVPNPRVKKPPVKEETIIVGGEPDTGDEFDRIINDLQFTIVEDEELPFPVEDKVGKDKCEGRKTTRKELFDELYDKYIDLKKKDRKNIIVQDMLPYFQDRKKTEEYVTSQFERKERNLISRRVRMCRKIFLAHFNYFCTFTYDSAKHTEESFKKKLQGCFKMMCHRKGWKYAGVWERAPETKRLHFHGLFNIPEKGMPGELTLVKDYDTKKNKMQETYQNTYFNERFGRSDFEPIEDNVNLGNAIAYLMKYMEKTGEKIVYSKGLPQYFISDIMDEDVVCPIGREDKKLLLFDDFGCWDEGCYMGQVSDATIKEMRKAN